MRLDLSGVGRSVEKAELDRSHPPNVIEVDVPIAGRIVVFRMRVRVSEPGLVKSRASGRLCLFKALDEGSVGAPGVVRDDFRGRSRRSRRPRL